MLSLLLLPFRLIGTILRVVFGFLGGMLGMIGGVIGAVFGVIGGVVSLTWNLLAVALIVGLIIAVFSKRKPKSTHAADNEDFPSFYDQR